jgi:signal transduction histidine kinase
VTLGRKAGLWAAAILLPPTIAISGFTSWTGARQIEDLTRRNLVLELARFQKVADDEFNLLKKLSLEQMDFYRENSQKKLVEWARGNGPQSGFLYIREGSRAVLAPRGPLAATLYQEAPFAPWGWTLGVAVSKSYLDEFGIQALWNTLWIDLVALLPLVFAAFVVSRSLSRPIDRLRLASEALARGDFSVRAQLSGTPEIQTLSRAFNAMAEHIQDLTASLEERVRARTEDLERSQQEMARKERLASLGSLVAGVAHEINTPLGICVTSASTLDNEVARLDKLYRSGSMAQDDFEAFLGTMAEGLRLLGMNLDRAHELVSSFKRLSVTQSAEHQRVFSPAEYLRDIVATLSHELKVAGITVELEADDLKVKGDPGLLSQVALNWMMNSLEHGFEARGGVIRFGLAALHNGLVLSYSDNGVGMPPDTLARLYEPFFTTKPQTGSGLGMSLVYTIIVDRLGGTIEAESEPGQGTSFRVFLPFGPGRFEAT